MRTSLLIGFASLLFAACTTLGVDDGSLSGSGSGSGSCDQPSSGLTCSVDDDCAADEECDDGRCKLHDSACDDDGDVGDDHGGGGGDDPPGDDHGGGGGDDPPGDDHGGGGDDPPGDDHGGGGGDDPQGDQCTVDADCGAGFECEHGSCAPHTETETEHGG